VVEAHRWFQASKVVSIPAQENWSRVLTSFSEEIERWKERGPDIVPEYYPVSLEDIDHLMKLAPVHQDLVEFWKQKGSATFNTDSLGRSVSTSLSNQLLDPAEIIFLINETFGIVEDLLPHGLPFFNMFDLEHLVITAEGKIISPNPDGSEQLVAATLQGFLDKLMLWPTCYDLDDCV
jgi:hypothetical protein